MAFVRFVKFVFDYTSESCVNSFSIKKDLTPNILSHMVLCFNRLGSVTCLRTGNKEVTLLALKVMNDGFLRFFVLNTKNVTCLLGVCYLFCKQVTPLHPFVHRGWRSFMLGVRCFSEKTFFFPSRGKTCAPVREKVFPN